MTRKLSDKIRPTSIRLCALQAQSTSSTGGVPLPEESPNPRSHLSLHPVHHSRVGVCGRRHSVSQRPTRPTRSSLEAESFPMISSSLSFIALFGISCAGNHSFVAQTAASSVLFVLRALLAADN